MPTRLPFTRCSVYQPHSLCPGSDVTAAGNTWETPAKRKHQPLTGKLACTLTSLVSRSPACIALLATARANSTDALGERVQKAGLLAPMWGYSKTPKPF